MKIATSMMLFAALAFVGCEKTDTATPDGAGWQVDLWNQHPSRTLTAHVWAGCVAVD